MHYKIATVLQDPHQWNGLSHYECEEIARSIAADLPHAFAFCAKRGLLSRHTTASDHPLCVERTFSNSALFFCPHSRWNGFARA